MPFDMTDAEREAAYLSHAFLDAVAQGKGRTTRRELVALIVAASPTDDKVGFERYVREALRSAISAGILRWVGDVGDGASLKVGNEGWDVIRAGLVALSESIAREGPEGQKPEEN